MNSDKPIKDENEDLLGFSLPAYKLAEAIIGYKEKETFVISIEGEWGSGKTSFMKLVENKLENEAIIVHFNPWAIVDFEQLTRYFFDELINTINYNLFSAKLTADAKAAVKGLQKFAAFLAPDEISHFGFTYKVKERLSPKKEQKTMYKLKNGINENLRKMDKKIVIIIDDIDRLMDKETETLFRLIKGIADFDNIIYILLYDKTIVGKSLEKFKGEKGEKYLDKIVQYPIIVPKPHAGVLEGLLFK
ncbi:MAG: KAP family NTPase, partial [Campylobacteraceae bacterium]|nr:KAP family NTPase [Campylobacteraceae bacterium]